jgi:VCBS repeat-containing protein
MLFALDVPVVPPQTPTIVLAHAADSASSNVDMVIRDCLTSYGVKRDRNIPINPLTPLEIYFANKLNQELDGKSVRLSILEQSKRAPTVLVKSEAGYSYAYYDISPETLKQLKLEFGNALDNPRPNGVDGATFLVEVKNLTTGKDMRIKLIMRYGVSYEVPGEPLTDVCPNPVRLNALPTDGTLVSSASDSVLGAGALANFTGVAGNVTLGVAALQAGALGQTTGTTIIFDDNAAGYNWFIDTTPADNSEFLPTSNPNEWVAREGSAAYGKMDMLSVLLHEYGHALGIEHSADSHDYMATTLTAGVRRMPSAAELALMQQLVGQVKAGLTESTLSPTLPLQGGGGFPTLPLGANFIGFLGLLRSSRYGGVSIAPDASTLVTKYAVAANATLVNGSLNAADGWSTLGSVDIGPSTSSGRTGGGATLNEVSGSQTRLSQVFMVNQRDRFLSFTLSGTALDDLTGAPDDAFEVALLDANTGASLLGGTGQTRTDAFLNLQADGTQNLANCVTCTNNADGSRTYRVDLAGVPAGVAANLSFDLIGFGQNNSHVTVSDVRLSGLPQLHDDAATMLEDGALAFNPFAQVDNAAVLQLGSHVVDQPAHGTVAVNADGTFVYTPAADYFGTDSFTYRLSDGPLESNLATVSITLTAVNDAPVVADVQATTAEDTALVIALGAYGNDVDSTTLTTQIVTGPAHGVLTQNADGSYT